MSKFIEKLKKVGEMGPNRLGFGASLNQESNPNILLIGSVSLKGLIKKQSLRKSPVDAFMVSVSRDDSLADVGNALESLLWGVKPDLESCAQAFEQVNDAGGDFIVFYAKGAPVEILADENLGKVVVIAEKLDDRYHMAYTGRFTGINRMGVSQKMHRVVFAVSDDGLTWTKLNKHYADPQNINDFASSADVTIINSEYVIYYTGQRNIIRATSQDGLTWVRQEIAFSAGHDSTMVKYDGVYYMFAKMPKALVYARNPDTELDLLVMAISHDGVNWPNNYYQVVVENEDGSEVEAENIQDPGAILLSNGSLRIFLNDFGGKSIYSIKPTATLPKPAPETTDK